MQAWEEKFYERVEGKAEGSAKLIGIIRKKFAKNMSTEEIAELLELEEEYVSQIANVLKDSPGADDLEIAMKMIEKVPTIV